MSIAMNQGCLLCMMGRHLNASAKLGDAKTGEQFAKALMKLYVDAPSGISSTYLSDQINQLYVQFYHLDPDRFRQEKARSNRFLLERLETLRTRVIHAADPIFAAFQLAILGNYIDYGALDGQVSFDTLDNMLLDAENMVLDEDCYRSFLNDLGQGTRLLYLTDNAGEIVLDRLLAETIHQRFPHLQITFCVRGGPVSNDATREDAALVGISFPVIDNGTCIGGTVPEKISTQALHAMETADVIISKGMGNCETLYGSPYHIYYAFLVKCQLFSEKFGKPLMTPILTM